MHRFLKKAPWCAGNGYCFRWIRPTVLPEWSRGHFMQRPPPPKQRWASTLANRSNARHRSNTRPNAERSERSNFFGKPKSKIVPCTSTFPKVELTSLPYLFLKRKARSSTCWVEGRRSSFCHLCPQGSTVQYSTSSPVNCCFSAKCH